MGRLQEMASRENGMTDFMTILIILIILFIGLIWFNRKSGWG